MEKTSQQEQDRPYVRLVSDGVDVAALHEGQAVGWKGGAYSDEIHVERANGQGDTYWTTEVLE